MAFSKLPDDVISQIISLTTPRDACRVSSVSTSFRSIADSDQVWLKFLPPDHDELVLPQIFSLDKKSAKKCFMIGARELAIPGGDDYRSWCWIAEPNSRFDQVAQLLFAGWFHIKARLETKMLSPKTRYAAYLVFQFRCHKSGFHRPAVSCVSVESDTDTHREWPTVVLDPGEGEPRSTRERGDGWLEIEMGEFYNENGDDGTLECSFKEVDEYTLRSGLVVEGIELRPKETY